MENLKRPTQEETDDDLLQQQELFMKEKTKPGVNLTKKYEQQNTSNVKQEIQDSFEKEEDTLMVIEEVVQEQNVSISKPFIFEPPPVSTSLDDDLLNIKLNPSKFKANKSQSIFAQLMEKKNLTEKKFPKKKVSSSSYMDGNDLPEKRPDIELKNTHEKNLARNLSMSEEEILQHQNLEGNFEERPDVEFKNIHEENLAKISSMSEEEILQYQNQLKQYLDPTLLKFIQNEGKKKESILLKHTNKQAANFPRQCFPCNKELVNEDESSDTILRKEGNDDCDALLLEKVIKLEANDNKEELSENSNVIKNKQIEIPDETKELLEASKEGHWKNMHKIEKEKLEWMSDLPKANPIDLKTGFNARFDFEGKLLTQDLETPVYKGLHHHGKEPEVAGYSLEELFLLARSTMQSQRITALHTLAHILDNYWYGMMDACFDERLLPIMLDAGIVPLLRWALDDTSITSIAATISVIHSLLISKSDEICLQRTFCWLNGHIMPQLEPQNLIESNVVTEELTDADLIKLDVVKAFLRMDILPRFYYILQVLQPPPLVCKLIIEICAHLAQHSIESAKQVINYHELLKLIFEKFMPLHWQFVEGSKLTDTVNFSYPVASAIKLMRIIASSSKELALHLVNNYNLVTNIIVYLTLHPNDKKVTAPEIQEIMIESLKTFQVLLCYGLAYNIFLELFPTFIKQMDFCLSLNMHERAYHIQDFEYATHLFKSLEAVATAKHDLSNSSSAAMNVIFKKALMCLEKWLFQFPQDKCNDHGMMLLSTVMNFVSMYYEKWHEELISKAKEPCSEVKEVFKNYLVPCIKSKIFKNLLEKLESYSLLLDSNKSGNARDSKTIISLGSILWKNDIVPLLSENSPMPLLLAIFQFCIVQKQIFNDIDNECLEELLQDKAIMKYLKSIIDKKLHVSNWFAKYECHLIFQILKLASLLISSDYLFWYKIATSILPTFRSPQEYVIEEIFEIIIFNRTFLLGNEAYEEILSKLPVIAKCYTACLLDSEALSHSSVNNRDLNPAINLQLTSSLQWIYMCHALHLPILKEIPSAVDFSYICMVFLLNEDFFRIPNIKALLQMCFSSLLKYKKIKLSKINWENLKDFDDMYNELLNQFEAVSYGDQLFGNFILFPLQQCYPSRWKTLLFTEYSQILQFLRVPLLEIFVSVKNYLEPPEKDTELIFQYCKALLAGVLTHVKCPLLYLMAIHHVNHFLFSRDSELLKLQKKLLSMILQSKNKNVQHQILLYSETNVNLECGFSVKQKLLPHDQEHLKGIIGHLINL
ncbi:RNA polymerase II-associated protein 1 [Caerostris darwini]|uniref:RNA polymerase II-associated protein 1 n=1 Tax=Caerostris darwini TaxID=1538125 RepID=A0AAV4RNA8_9ARAC|nr:RNA polymerase II-associated protein 1 [Caerostris darwini]